MPDPWHVANTVAGAVSAAAGSASAALAVYALYQHCTCSDAEKRRRQGAEPPQTETPQTEVRVLAFADWSRANRMYLDTM